METILIIWASLFSLTLFFIIGSAIRFKEPVEHSNVFDMIDELNKKRKRR